VLSVCSSVRIRLSDVLESGAVRVSEQHPIPYTPVCQLQQCNSYIPGSRGRQKEAVFLNLESEIDKHVFGKTEMAQI